MNRQPDRSHQGMNRKETYPKRLQQLHGALVQPVAIQVILVIVSALILDGGFCSGIVMVGVIAHWIVVGVIALRRRDNLSRTDETLIRVGYVLWSGLAFFGYIAASYLYYWLEP